MDYEFDLPPGRGVVQPPDILGWLGVLRLIFHCYRIRRSRADKKKPRLATRHFPLASQTAYSAVNVKQIQSFNFL